MPVFVQNPKILPVMAGPCMAESFGLMDEVCSFLKPLAKELGFEFIFKASFDKANRTSFKSFRGPGVDQASQWFADIKSKHKVKILTDVHETHQVRPIAQVCDVLQIPAFLSRQTDLIVAAAQTGRAVNVKKGQFMSPDNAAHIAAKIREVCREEKLEPDFAVTERGVSFGYGNLVVDMRGFPIISNLGIPTVFDITHSLQLPSAGGQGGEVSSGLRQYAPALARAAAATGYLDGLFLEVHTNPNKALSDAATQLSFLQAESLLRQIIPMIRQANALRDDDKKFSV